MGRSQMENEAERGGVRQSEEKGGRGRWSEAE